MWPVVLAGMHAGLRAREGPKNATNPGTLTAAVPIAASRRRGRPRRRSCAPDNFFYKLEQMGAM